MSSYVPLTGFKQFLLIFRTANWQKRAGFACRGTLLEFDQ